MEEKKNGLKVLVIILVILILGLGGYIVYDKVLSKPEEVVDKPVENVNKNDYKKLADEFVVNNLYSIVQANDYCNADIIEMPKDEMKYEDLEERVTDGMFASYMLNFKHGDFSSWSFEEAYKEFYGVNNVKLKDKYNYIHGPVYFELVEDYYYKVELIATGCEGFRISERIYDGYEVKDNVVIVYSTVNEFDFDYESYEKDYEKNNKIVYSDYETITRTLKYAYTFKKVDDHYQFVSIKLVK